MKKTISRMMYFAVLTALVCIGCGGDDGAQNKSLEIGNLLNVITGRGGDVSTPTTHTLTVNVSPTESGTVSRSKNADSYEHGTQITLTAKPNNGYEFIGWTGALNSTELTVTVTMDGDKALLAGFRRIGADLPQYNVYFNANGATGIPPEMVSSDSGSIISLPSQASMVKDKYGFAGWNTEANGSGENYNIYGKYTVIGNATLFAQWTRNPYTLTINVSPPNSGAVSRNPNKETYVHGEQITVTATPTNGNAFKGWSGASSSKNNTITIVMDDDKTLTAGFGMPDAKQFTVYFNGNGTTGGSAPATISADSGSKITLPGQQTMEKTGGYIFDGWTINNSGTGTSYGANDSYTVTKDVTLYAKWIRFYTVTFNGNGTTVGVPEAVKADSGTLITLSTITRTGYRFDGWNTNNSGTGINYATNFSYIVTNNVTLYAKWIPIYTVNYNGNGTTVGVPQAVTADSGTTITLPAMTTRTGYKFVGWNTNSSGTGTNYVTNFSYTVTSNITLYAKWIPIYTVTYNGNGTTIGVPQAVTADSGTTITLPAMTISGYKFVGWNTNSTGTGIDYSEMISYTVTNNITFYAKWIRTYTLTINVSPLGGGSISRSPDQIETSYASGTDVTVTATPTSGYKFAEWLGVMTGTTNSVTITMNDDKILTAMFYQPSTFTDTRNSKTYKTVKIDNQTWMAENLNYQTTSGSWCYGESADSCTKYGRLYDWNMANTVCPTGWHLPSIQEWRTLVTTIGGASVAGKKLKSASGWASNSGTDDYGFSALPGGNLYSTGSFGYTGIYGHWWTATEYNDNASDAYYWNMNYSRDYVYEDHFRKSGGVSVRCLQD